MEVLGIKEEAVGHPGGQDGPHGDGRGWALESPVSGGAVGKTLLLRRVAEGALLQCCRLLLDVGLGGHGCGPSPSQAPLHAASHT